MKKFTKQDKEKEKYYLFKERKKVGYVTISRHEFPDFCAGMTKEQRDKEFIVKEVWI